MKRKEPIADDSPRHGRRQPQVSCDFCRSKKLKCDRGAPCASCTVRGLECSSQASQPGPLPPLSESSSSTGADSSILSRLQKLERAVFGTTGEDQHAQLSYVQTIRPSKTVLGHNPGSVVAILPSDDDERLRTARILDNAYTSEDHSNPSQAGRFHFRIETVASLANTPQSVATDGSLVVSVDAHRSAWIMTREEAMLLLNDFFDRPFHLLPFLYKPTVALIVDRFYNQLKNGEAGDSAYAALILSIGALSAFSYDEDNDSQRIFNSAEEAAQTAKAWITSACHLLDDADRGFSSTLEECQARAVLTQAVYNTEGCSARFRFLHSCCITAARDLSLHVIDSPCKAEKRGDVITAEMKRRLWWHIAGSDWLLGTVGSPLDGTYIIQPRHMNVKKPRNINDSDLNLYDETMSFPHHIYTEASCFIQRIRIAEISRAIIDARDPGFPDMEITDVDKVVALDTLFAKALDDLPGFMHPGTPLPPSAPSHLVVQRAILMLGLHIRRARLHRPFLFHDTENPRYRLSRQQCTESARTVISISIDLLEDSPAALTQKPHSESAVASRLGLVISAMFMACAMLALEAGRRSTRSGESGNVATRQGSAGVHTDFDRACQVLTMAAKKSSFAASLVRKLSNVLTKHSGKSTNSATDDISITADRHTGTLEPSSSGRKAEDVVPMALTENGPPAGSDQYTTLSDEFGFDNLWDELFHPASDIEGYSEMFAGLDAWLMPS
ncbi:hypothetical protein BX600DRAFT_437074 [Xylariales sp. PMI_506]|nr:hypothetical protein BX600DRAFT_437074 [Xylariales sp. PMI_506]